MVSLLLLPRFCCVEMLGLALFAFYDFGEVSINHSSSYVWQKSDRCFPSCSQRITFCQSTKLLDCFRCSSVCFFARSVWPNVLEHHFFVAVSCLQLNRCNRHMNPHICYQSFVAFSQLFPSVLSVNEVFSGQIDNAICTVPS